MSVLFVNTMTDTFTPTNSYATATWVWELCQSALSEPMEPWVISSDSTFAPYDWKRLILIPAPRKPKSWLATKVNNQFRHRTGWVHPGQYSWCRRVVAAIKRHRLQHLPMVLSNDIELAVYLRRQFPHAFILHLAQNYNGARDNFRRAFAPSVNVACAVSDHLRQWNEEYFKFPAGAMKTVLNGVNCEAFFPADPPLHGPPVIDFHGRLDPEKGPDILLKAALRVAKRSNAFSIQFVGRRFHHDDKPRDYDLELEAMERDLGKLGVRVERTGWIDRRRLPEILRRAQISVIPSRWNEPCALTVLEALATGIAVIGSDTGGTAQVMGDAGFLFNRDDDAQLAELLEPLVRDPGLRAEYGRRARLRAEELTWQKTWQQLKALLPIRSTNKAPDHLELNEPALH